MEKSEVTCAIFVQCLNRSWEEVGWVSSLARKHPFIKGIVGGLDLTQPEDQLRQQIRQAGDILVRKNIPTHIRFNLPT